LLDRTPPEAEIFFDPENEDLAVRGVDNLDPFVDISVTEKVIKNRTIRTYTLTDNAGNTTELQIDIKLNNHEIKAEIIDLKYNDESVTLPKNSFKIEHVIEDGNIKMLNQFLVIGDAKVHLIYSKTNNQTKIITNGVEEIHEGVSLVVFRTEIGHFTYQIQE
jgi:hypothetical protein